MPGTVSVRHDTRVLSCDPDGPTVASEQDALDLLGDAFGHRATLVALPVSRLDARFFTLENKLAGEIMQKFANYQVRLAIVGDIEAHLANSSALRALVYESNRGRLIWFVADTDELDRMLAERG